jgi:DNA-3-methyladenine glycosylase
MKSLPLSFFNRPTVAVARELVGCYLAVRRGTEIERRMITETEAYDGFLDKASHAHRGMTKRNEAMFGECGHMYVYFTYGIHWMLNIVTGERGYPAAVLIRSVEGLHGPARLTKALGITGALNGKRLGRATSLWIEAPRPADPKPKVKASARIGVEYSGPVWSKRRYRFHIA